MSDNKSEYNHILKATSIFGGVQFFNILISIAKSKIVAILIGTAGLGILGILTSTINLILGLSRMGLDFSSVKEISASKANQDKRIVSKKVYVTKRITWVTGLLGALIVLIISPFLSKIAFGNTDFTVYFIIISLAVFFNQMTLGNMAILQGFNQLRKIAKSSVFASFFALIFASILYYFLGQIGIPWVIVITAITAYLFSRYYQSNITLDKTSLSYKETYVEGKGMLKVGFVLSLGTIASLVTTYFVQIYITNRGGINEVGLYSAGLILMDSYVLFFFNAISKDFFPRLSEIASDNSLVKNAVNKQMVITVLLLMPIIVLFLVFKTFIVKILFTEDFLPIVGMVTFGIVGVLFKAISWIMGFVIVAKNDSKLYATIEAFSNLILFAITVLGYNLNGITGVGIGYLVYYILYAILIKCIVSYNYKFSFDLSSKKVILVSIFFCFTTLYLVSLENTFLNFTLLTIVVLSSIIYTLFMLNRFIELKELFEKIKLK